MVLVVGDTVVHFRPPTRQKKILLDKTAVLQLTSICTPSRVLNVDSR